MHSSLNLTTGCSIFLVVFMTAVSCLNKGSHTNSYQRWMSIIIHQNGLSDLFIHFENYVIIYNVLSGEQLPMYKKRTHSESQNVIKYTLRMLWLEYCGSIKWKHFPHYWPFVRGIHRYPWNSPHKGHWRGALMFSLIWDYYNWDVPEQTVEQIIVTPVIWDTIVLIMTPL